MSEIKYIEPQQESQLYNDVCQIIDGARSRIATYVNTEACLTNWYVGKRIKEDVLYNKRAEYGKQVVRNLSIKLTERYGTGWGYEKLKHCVRSAYLFSEEEIRYATRTQLNWTHLRSLMGIKDPLNVSSMHRCVAQSIGIHAFLAHLDTTSAARNSKQ